MDKQSDVLQPGILTNLPSRSTFGYIVQGLSFLPSMLLGYWIMYIVKVMFAVNSDQYGVWIIFISFFIVREVLAAINPKIFDLKVRRALRDTLIIVGAYVLGMTVPILVRMQLPIRGFWNFLIALVLTWASIYLPCFLLGSSELRRAILPTKRETHNP